VTQAIDQVWASSITQAQLAVAQLTKAGQEVPKTVQDSVARLGIIGTLLDQKPPTVKEGTALPRDANPLDVVKNAEASVQTAIQQVAEATVKIGSQIDPKSLPKEAAAALDAVQARVTSALYAATAAAKLVPVADAQPAPAEGTAAPATSAPASAPSARAATPTPTTGAPAAAPSPEPAASAPTAPAH
jgi:hypothetical protein